MSTPSTTRECPTCVRGLECVIHVHKEQTCCESPQWSGGYTDPGCTIKGCVNGNHPLKTAKQTGSWEESFYELTKTMDGQDRPKLKLLIQSLLQAEREKGIAEGRREMREEVARLFAQSPLQKRKDKDADRFYLDVLSLLKAEGEELTTKSS